MKLGWHEKAWDEYVARQAEDKKKKENVF